MPVRTRLRPSHHEQHRSGRLGWLRAGVLGANDGLLSVASLIVGVAAADNTRQAVTIAGLAALVAGAFSMAVGEYASVSSQRDSELADLEREREELTTQPGAERRELALIYERRGLPAELAARVSEHLTARTLDPIGLHRLESTPKLRGCDRQWCTGQCVLQLT